MPILVDLHPDDKNSGEKDTLFQNNIYPKSGFVFDDQVTEVFDNMLYRSIPHYYEVIKITCDLLLKKGPGGLLYDLGFSTGNFLFNLAKQDFYGKYHECRGIDNSSAMVKKAENKYLKLKQSLSAGVKIIFLCDDLISHDYLKCGGITLHYTLQFISPDQRKKLIHKLYTALSPGGLLVLSEKVEESGSLLREFFIDRYYLFKKTNNYTADEIARKKEALEEVLIPFTVNHYENILKQTGFREVAIAFKWYNFITWFAMK